MRQISGMAFYLPLATLLLGSGGGCGYSLGYRAPTEIRTVAVPIFQNQSFPLYREIEYELTSIFREEIQARTPLHLSSSETADLVVLGTIRDFRQATVAEDENDRAIESMLIVAVSLIVEDYVHERRWEEDLRVAEPFSVQLGDTTATVKARAFKNLSERMLLAIKSWEEE